MYRTGDTVKVIGNSFTMHHFFNIGQEVVVAWPADHQGDLYCQGDNGLRQFVNKNDVRAVGTMRPDEN